MEPEGQQSIKDALEPQFAKLSPEHHGGLEQLPELGEM